MTTPKAKRFEGERRDPFRNFNFHIVIDNLVVAACRKMSALDATVNTVKFRSGDNRSPVDECMPGRVEYQPVTLESGLTNDDTFEKWANEVVFHENSDGSRSNDNEFRKDVTIRVLDLDGKTVVKEFILFRAWPSKFTAMSDLAGDGNDVIIETLELTHEGFKHLQ
jgi:phage tail-like protein